MKTKIIFPAFILLFVISIRAQVYTNDFNDNAAVGNETGIAFAMAEFGSGFGGFYAWPVSKTMHIGAGMDVYFLRDAGQIEFFDPLYGPIQVGKENNVYIFDLTFNLKKRFFGKELDESLRPFFTAGLGPVYGMNFPEFDRDPEGNKNYDQFAWTLGGLVGFGADISTGPSVFASVRVQYRVLPFPEEIGERKNQSMIELRIEIGKRFINLR